jgi:hypothetical protein
VLLSAPVFSSPRQTRSAQRRQRETTTKKDGRKLSIRINRNTTPDPSNNIKRHPAASRTVSAGLPIQKKKQTTNQYNDTRRRNKKEKKNTAQQYSGESIRKSFARTTI